MPLCIIQRKFHVKQNLYFIYEALLDTLGDPENILSSY